MSLQTAAIVFRYGVDDFVLWSVDLPSSILHEAKRSENTAFGNLDFVIEQIPIWPEEDHSVLHFLFPEGKHYSLFAKETEPGFMAAQRNNGCSVRGGKDDIIADLQEHFQDQIPCPSLTM